MSIEELWISSRVVPRSRGEIVGILKQVGDEMGADLNDDDPLELRWRILSASYLDAADEFFVAALAHIVVQPMAMVSVGPALHFAMWTRPMQ